MSRKSVGVLLINLGTPESTSVKDIRKYLKEFLMDPRVIDISTWKRWLLVNGIIAPFRAPKVQKEYLKLALPEGLPLRIISEDLERQLQENTDFEVVLAMRYGAPSIASQLDILRDKMVDQIIILPLFPQYASATNGTAIEEVFRCIKGWNVIPNMRVISYFHDHPLYIKAMTNKIKRDLDHHQPDHLLFSFHGIPVSQLKSLGNHCKCIQSTTHCDVCSVYCYRSACFQTASLIAKELGISEKDYSVAFQSRLGKTPWIEPYTDQTIKQLAKQYKKLHVVAPSFVTDCLETTIEIGEQYRELYYSFDGEQFTWTESLNQDKEWIEALSQIIQEKVVS
ncbi:ferrochelatase [Halosquirtibacter xylanolyticus]|uniref:ferrochelatase n=1 Tax=Halosquirtibacter xylanolyticus TaxID=3374599 RepID=UPI00374A83D7|nr:ferrochelatase [Prolixibacteraceae bacterium]